MSAIADFSGYEVIRAAMEVERSGREFYQAMATLAKQAAVKQVFSQLARDEIQHLKTLESMLGKYEDAACWEEEAEFLPYLQRFRSEEIFPSAARLEQALASGQPEGRALELAIEAEEKFAEFFRRAAAVSRSTEGARAFSWLAGEEDEHAALLRERYTAPAA